MLDRAIVTREVGFYALGIVLLYIALRDIQPVDDDDVEHIFISFPVACMVFSGYILYVVVCANMTAVVKFFGGAPVEVATSPTKKPRSTPEEEDALVSGSSPGKYGSTQRNRTFSEDIDIPDDMQYVTEKKNLSAEPASNWAAISLYMPKDKVIPIEDTEEAPSDEAAIHAFSRRGSSMPYERSSILVDMFQHTEPPSKTHDLYEVRYNEVRKKFDYLLVLPHTLHLPSCPRSSAKTWNVSFGKDPIFIQGLTSAIMLGT